MVPFPLGWSSDPDGTYWMLALFQDATAWGNESCQMLSLLFPEVRGLAGQPLRTVKPPAPDVNYTSCLKGWGGEGRLTNVENLMGYSESQSFNSLTNPSTLSVDRADVWWYCGRPLFEILPSNWAGTGALVQLVIPFILAFRSPTHVTPPRKRRDIGIDVAARHRGSLDPCVYIDATGVPRRVPNEFKARNQIATGFESVLFWWSTINKNVDWINYIYYNKQRFVNYTRDTIEEIAEQLGPISQMAWENS
jgi:hypothetical protein